MKEYHLPVDTRQTSSMDKILTYTTFECLQEIVQRFPIIDQRKISRWTKFYSIMFKK